MWDDEKQVWRYESPLVTASRLGQFEMVVLLLRAGAEMDIPDNSLGKTALNWACTRRHTKVVQILIQNGAQINQGDYATETPMTEAVGNRDFDIVMLLILRGVNLNVHVNYDRDTALLFAMLINETSMARELIQAGANVNVINRNGEECMSCVIISPVIRQEAMALYLCELLILAGYKVKMGQLNKARAIGDGDCANVLEEAIYHPCSLASMARMTIRQVLVKISRGTTVKPWADLLPLPTRLKQMIKLEIMH